QGGGGALSFSGGYAGGVTLFFEVAASDGILLQQPLGSCQLGGGVGYARLGRGKLGTGAIYRSPIGSGINREEDVAFVHHGAVGEMHRGDRSRYLRTDLYMVDSFEATGVFSLIGNTARQHGGHVNCRRLRSRF